MGLSIVYSISYTFFYGKDMLQLEYKLFNKGVLLSMGNRCMLVSFYWYKPIEYPYTVINM